MECASTLKKVSIKYWRWSWDAGSYQVHSYSVFVSCAGIAAIWRCWIRTIHCFRCGKGIVVFGSWDHAPKDAQEQQCQQVKTQQFNGHFTQCWTKEEKAVITAWYTPCKESNGRASSAMYSLVLLRHCNSNNTFQKLLSLWTTSVKVQSKTPNWKRINKTVVCTQHCFLKLMPEYFNGLSHGPCDCDSWTRA